jgi:phosphoenolpyruvate carboxykinase (GTP)
VLKWAIERIEGKAGAQETPIGYVPTAADLDTDGLTENAADFAEALKVDADEWRAELPLIQEWFDKIGEKVPSTLHDELAALRERLA